MKKMSLTEHCIVITALIAAVVLGALNNFRDAPQPNIMIFSQESSR